MNKFKFYIMPPEQSDFDKRLSTKIKKFSSERNLFFSNIYNSEYNNSGNNINSINSINSINNINNINNNNNNNNITTSNKNSSNNNGVPLNAGEKLRGRVERTKSFFINGFMKRCKSSRDLFSSSSTESSVAKESNNRAKATITDTDLNNDKLLSNVDEFERNFLSSAGKKILVRELRKNFEANEAAAAAPPPPSAPLIRLWKSKSSVSAQKKPPIKKKDTIDGAEVQLRNKSHQNGPDGVVKKPLISRHSFYNTYRNEYLATNDKHSSNLSLNFCGTKSGSGGGSSVISTKTLTRAFNRFSRSSSTANLSAIESTPSLGHRGHSYSLYSVNSLTNGDGDGGSFIYNGTDDDYDERGRHNETQSLVHTHTGYEQQSVELHSHTDYNNVADDDNNEEDLFKIYVQCNNKINNINNGNVKLKKCNSVSQIDLDMLRNELDEFIDMKMCSNHLLMGFRSQRRYLHRKVNLLAILL